MNKPGITQLQHWMKEVITRQGGMAHKLQTAAHLYHLQAIDVVAETRNVPIYARINIYTSGYVMRLLECIEADFPVLNKFMGDEVFRNFAEASLMWRPSTSYSLYDLGGTFINFLEATRPKQPAMPEDERILLELPIEIARAERARQETIRANGTEHMAPSYIEISPGDILFNALHVNIATPDCLRLLISKFPVKQLFDQLHDEGAYEIPVPNKTFVVISRTSYHPVMEEVEEWQYLFLASCRVHTILMDAINATAAAANIPASTLLAQLCIWLPVFRDKGFVIVTL